MSRGFVKEEDQESIPIVPPRADLPKGVTNYVTPNGMDELRAERKKILGELEKLEISDEKERRIAVNHINAKLQLLDERISTAKVVKYAEETPEEVRFGAIVTVRVGDTIKENTYQIVGVDEADINQNKISFISPMARVLINKKVGDITWLMLGEEKRVYKILRIEYAENTV